MGKKFLKPLKLVATLAVVGGLASCAMPIVCNSDGAYSRGYSDGQFVSYNKPDYRSACPGVNPRRLNRSYHRGYRSGTHNQIHFFTPPPPGPAPQPVDINIFSHHHPHPGPAPRPPRPPRPHPSRPHHTKLIPTLGPGGTQHLIGPGGTQHLIGPGGTRKPTLGPGGTQQLIGPGGTRNMTIKTN